MSYIGFKWFVQIKAVSNLPVSLEPFMNSGTKDKDSIKATSEYRNQQQR